MPQTAAEGQKLSISQFADRIRTQHPGVYDELDNLDLTRRILRKYPDYQDVLDVQVPMEPLRPQEPTFGDVAGRFAENALGGLRRTAVDIAEGAGLPAMLGVGKELAGLMAPSGLARLVGEGPGAAMPQTSAIAGGLGRLAAETATAGPGAAMEGRRTGDIGLMARGALASAMPLTSGLVVPEQAPASRAMVEGVGRPVTEVAGGIREGDPERIREGLSEGLGTALAIYAGTPQVRARIGTGLQRTGEAGAALAHTAQAGLQRAGGAVRRMIPGGPVQPSTALTQALRPRNALTRWSDDLARAMPELKASEAQLGRAVSTIDDLDEAARLAQRRVRAQYDAIAGPQGSRGINGDPIANAIERSVSRKVQLENPALAERIGRLSDVYRRTFSVDELDDLLRTTNAELNSYYARFPTNQRAAVAGNPNTAYMVHQAEAIRDTLYKALDAPGQGQAARELNRRYGSLITLRDALERRQNVMLRQAPENLTQQLSKVGAAIETVRGAGNILTGRFTRGAGRIGGAYAGRKMADYMRQINSTDDLIRRAMLSITDSPAPVNAAPFTPAGLLPSRAGSPFAMPEGGNPIEAATPWVGRETAVAAFPRGVRVQGVTVEGPSGEVFQMPAPVRALLPERATPAPGLLAERAGGPFVTPLPKMSLREYAEMLSREAARRAQ